MLLFLKHISRQRNALLTRPPSLSADRESQFLYGREGVGMLAPQDASLRFQQLPLDAFGLRNAALLQYGPCQVVRRIQGPAI
jgi:hypothetical protein